MDPFLPQWLVTAGLVGCVVALVVATAQQNWRPRVFFLLALRVAIGWQFLSEGLNKIQSHAVGAVDPANPTQQFSPDLPKPFSSGPYFSGSDGPLAGLMRERYAPDPDKTLYDLVRPATNPKTVGDLLGEDGVAAVKADFAKGGPGLTVARMYGPKLPAGADAASHYATALAALPLNGPGGPFLADYLAKGGADAEVRTKVLAQLPPDAERGIANRVNLVTAAVDAARLDAPEAEKRKALVLKIADAERLEFARWAVGVDTKAGKKKNVVSDVVQGVPARLADYDNRKAELAELEGRRAVDLGRSTLFARIAGTKADMQTVRADLTKEAKDMLDATKADLAKAADVTPPADPLPEEKKIVGLDRLTMWTLTIAGACLMFGLGTRISAVVCGGFLVMTYLTTTPLPWYPNPPGTEGNPVFVNKNLIEAFACFALACFPTGRWMGPDGLIYFLYHGSTKGDAPMPPAV